MNLDHPFSVALIAACTLVLAAHYARPWLDTLRARRIARRTDYTRQPGSLYEAPGDPEFWNQGRVNEYAWLVAQVEADA